MFGNKNAGPHETWMGLGLHRQNAKPKNVLPQAAIPISRKGFEMFDQRETYFAVGSPIRWKL
jgi:hypothetical protein